MRGGDILAGTWVKTPHPNVVEVWGLSNLDCLVLDAEHAPFDRGSLDVCILAARAAGIAVIVRPASSLHDAILQALEGGTDGVIVPHVSSAAEARVVAAACQYVPGGRGFAGSTRAAAYTTLGMAKHREASRNVAIIAQIEDFEALDEIDAIASVEGIDALFIGRADLTISMEAECSDNLNVVQAVEQICAEGRKAGRAVGMFLSRAADVPQWRD